MFFGLRVRCTNLILAGPAAWDGPKSNFFSNSYSQLSAYDDSFFLYNIYHVLCISGCAPFGTIS